MADGKPALRPVAGPGADINVRHGYDAQGPSHSYHRIGIALIRLESTIGTSFASERALNYRRARCPDVGGLVPPSGADLTFAAHLPQVRKSECQIQHSTSTYDLLVVL